MEEENNINKSRNLTEKSIENAERGNLLEGSHLYTFLYKKAEKLSSALYMVTNFIPESEMLRGLLRERSINIFSGIINLQKMSLKINKSFNINNDSEVSLDSTLSFIMEINSLLDIAFVSGYISEMNSMILRREYVDLGILIKTRKEDIKSGNISLTKDFFNVPDLYETYALKQELNKNDKIVAKNINSEQKSIRHNKTAKLISKGHFIKDIKNIKNIEKRQKIDINPKTSDIRHNSRRNAILELLQKASFITTKDALNTIHGCSSKTLQRELQALINEGVLEKKGSKRWSVYSLARRLT